MKNVLLFISVLLLAYIIVGCHTKMSKEEMARARITDNKEEFIRILRSTGRPGMENVIRQLDTTDIYTLGAGGHHTKEGGLVQHSLEVYRIMKVLALFQKNESIAIVALFHDMGKIDKGGYHTWRSVKHLKEWGLEMTDKEYIAIFRHHNLETKYARNPLYRALVVSDAISTGWWKLWHKKAPKNQDV